MTKEISKEEKDIKHLLQNVSTIVKNYDKIAEITGEKYNVFNILGLGNDELSHSAIITNLLNAQGSHGQKDLFLKLFIDVIQAKFKDENFQNTENVKFDLLKINDLQNFNTENSKAQKEKHAGKVDFINSEGGRIDILITSGSAKIIVENKIYAIDQHQQLVRYKNHDPNAIIFYLNLFGDKPSAKSIQGLIENKDFFIITYRNEITNWLQKCIEKVANKPIIRETLNQYLNLINRLTNQSNNNEMKMEISEVILKDPNIYESFVSLYNSANDIKKEMVTTIVKNIEKIVIENGFTVEKVASPSKDYRGVLIEFNNSILKDSNLSVRLNFEGKNYTNLIFGLYRIDKNIEVSSSFTEHFSMNFKNVLNTHSYPVYFKYENFTNWYLINLKEIYFGESFYTDFKEKIEKIKQIIN